MSLRSIAISVAKAGYLILIVAMAFFAVLVFGLSANGKDLYSSDHLAWREAVYGLIDPGIPLAGLALWFFALADRKPGWRVVAKAAAGIFASVLLMQIDLLKDELGVGRMIALVIGGALIAAWTARRRSWIAIGLASAPCVVVVLAVVGFIAFAPPNTAL